MPGAVTGNNMIAYRNTGTYTVPVWAAVAEIGDLQISDLSRSLASLKRRSNKFAKNLPALVDSITLTFTYIHGLGASVFTTLQTNFFAGTCEEWAIADGAIATAGTQALRCPLVISEFPWDQPLEEVSSHAIKMVTGYLESPAGTERDPVWYTTP